MSFVHLVQHRTRLDKTAVLTALVVQLRIGLGVEVK